MFGDNLSNAIYHCDVSQKYIADCLEVTPRAVQRWCRGETEPDIKKLIKLSQIFGISIDELVGNNETHQAFDEDFRKKVLKDFLVKANCIGKNEILTEDKIGYFIKFLKANKDFIKMPED